MRRFVPVPHSQLLTDGVILARHTTYEVQSGVARFKLVDSNPQSV
jgi:hypothetical protein